MDKKLYLNNLYDYYYLLLTEKQREYYEAYYFNDLSLAEIAENNSVSRNAIHGQIKNVEERLEFYEESLGLYKKAQRIKELITKIDPDIKKEIEELI
jgi:hypothetical protein